MKTSVKVGLGLGALWLVGILAFVARWRAKQNATGPAVSPTAQAQQSPALYAPAPDGNATTTAPVVSGAARAVFYMSDEGRARSVALAKQGVMPPPPITPKTPWRA